MTRLEDEDARCEMRFQRLAKVEWREKITLPGNGLLFSYKWCGLFLWVKCTEKKDEEGAKIVEKIRRSLIERKSHSVVSFVMQGRKHLSCRVGSRRNRKVSTHNQSYICFDNQR